MENMDNWKKKAVLFIVSQGITLFGSAVTQFAIVWYVTLKTSSGAWVSALTVCSFVPQFIISFFSGVWADRFSRRALIIISDSVIAAATLALVLLMPRIGEGEGLLWALAGVSVVRALGAGVQTPAVNAMIPQLVPESALMKFNGANSTVQSAVQFAAPAVAGAVLSLGTLGSALMIDILTAAAGIGLLACIALPRAERPADAQKTASVFADMKAGFRYAVKESFIGRLLLVFGVFIFLCVPAGFLATLFVSRYYGDTYWYLTIVEVVGFAGMMAGGVLIGAWGGFKNRVTTLLLGMTAFGVLAALMGAVNSFIVYLVMMAVYGVALTMVQTACTTLLQEHAAPDMQGRVFGFFGAMYSGFLPLGMAVFGPMSDAVSMRLIMVASGVLLILMAGVLALNGSFRRAGIPARPPESGVQE